MLFLRKPSAETINAFLAGQAGQPFSYAEVGASHGEPPPGYDVDQRQVCLGKGKAVFETAGRALQGWRMFQLGWTHLCWPDTPVQPGAVVGVLARLGVVWWLNACRVVYILDESGEYRRVGFAYGTLPDHAEYGEERFTVEWRADDSVWYDVFAFSRPKHPLARLAYPLAIRVQKRFRVGSLAAMRRAVQDPALIITDAGGVP